MLEPRLVEPQPQPNDLDPTVWWRMLVDAVIALRYGDYSFANAYAAFVKKHRGTEAAKAAQSRMQELSTSEAWANCHEWPAWGYACKPPSRETAPKKAAPKRRKR